LIHRMDRENFKVRIHEADLIEVERVMTSLVRRFLFGVAACTGAIIVTLSPSENKIFLSVVIGGLALVVIALLLAPVPGSAAAARRD
ncbi:MAG: hypothetical protein ACF8AM_20810, partial [Rhodopirellula sp. JB055]|uniref:hypothetical protein n=1 Tax=Rhodopirellula sp. JB055 TaxID=3342846 RepID=UPI00370B3FD4